MKNIRRLFICLISSLFITASSLFGQKVAQETDTYMVVINHEEQYSILPFSKETSKDWKFTKVAGDMDECLAYISETWTDMRPLSIQKMNLTDKTKYQVVVNHEEQYSIWPVGKEIPKNCKALEIQGSLKECHDYISEAWTDMRPLSVRKKME